MSTNYAIDLNKLSDQQMLDARVAIRLEVVGLETQTFTGDEYVGYPVRLDIPALAGAITLVPIRPLYELLGCPVIWIASAETQDAHAQITLPNGILNLYPGAASVIFPDGTVYTETAYTFPDGTSISLVYERAGCLYITARLFGNSISQSVAFQWSKNAQLLTIRGISSLSPCTVIKNQAFHPEADHGAHYYAYSKELDILLTYPKAAANIVLPNAVQVTGTAGEVRIAYISLGIYGGYHENDSDYLVGVDLGIGCQDGVTWHPVWYDSQNKNGAHYFQYHSTPDTTNALITIVILTDRKIDFYINFVDANGNLTGDPLHEIVSVVKPRTWTRYYRFASLVPKTVENRQDGTRILGGCFTQSKLHSQHGSEPWGIDSHLMEFCHILYYPRCQITNITQDGESFDIHHYVE